MSPSDHDLLRNYARDGSQAAFATLVERHLNLVYSAAHRQVRSPQLAEEVAQSVFVDLARSASRLGPNTAVVAWLHVVSRRTAIDVVRRESRRQAREHEAAEIARGETACPERVERAESTAMKPSSSDWTAVEPLLDEAVESLNATDRTAILLRYFENKSLREIGATLGASEDAAQKRVSRAVEQLRTFFLCRGIAITAAGLATDLSAHALQIAPAGLSATISTAATLSGAAGSVATLEATKAIAMTTIQKSIIAATLALVVSGALYESSVFARQKSDIALLEQRTTNLSAQLRQTRDQQIAAAHQLKSVEKEIDGRLAKPATPIAGSDGALELQMKAWLANLDQLKHLIEQQPNLGIPELQFVPDEIWLSVASGAKLDSEAGIRQALATLRHSAENTMASKLSQALNACIKASNGVLPDHVTQLLPFFDPPVDPALLDRYEMLQTGKLSEVPSGRRMDIVAAKSPVDVEYDAYWRIGVGYGNSSAMSYNFSNAQRAFATAHDGQRAATATELLPYLKWPVEEAVLQKFMNPRPTSGTP